MTPHRNNKQSAKHKKWRASRVVVVQAPPARLECPVRKLFWALIRVTAESEANQGKYPPTNRKPRIAQVIQRAGLPASFLEKRNKNPDARDLRNSRIKQKIRRRLGLLHVVHSSTYKSVDASDNSIIRSLRDGWHKTELELVQIRAENAELRRELEKLKSLRGNGP